MWSILFFTALLLLYNFTAWLWDSWGTKWKRDWGQSSSSATVLLYICILYTFLVQRFNRPWWWWLYCCCCWWWWSKEVWQGWELITSLLSTPFKTWFDSYQPAIIIIMMIILMIFCKNYNKNMIIMIMRGDISNTRVLISLSLPCTISPFPKHS